MATRTRVLRVVAGSLSAVGAAALASWPAEQATRRFWLAHGGPWLLLLLLAAALWAAAEATRRITGSLRQAPSGARSAAGDTLFALALTGVVFAAVAPDYRILADETNLLSESLALHRFGRFANLVQGYFFMERLFVVEEVTPHRPGLFPMLTALLHTLRGYSPQHPFVVNFAVCALLLTALARTGRRLLGGAGGYLAAGLAAAVPLTAVYATSGGYDLLAATMLALLLWTLVRLRDEPTALNAELALWVGVAAGHARYEGVLLLLPACLGVLWQRRRIDWSQLSWRPLLAPWVLVPIAWQRLVSTHVANAGDSNAGALSFAHLPGNALGALRFLADMLDGTPGLSSRGVVALACAGLVLALLHLQRALRSRGFRDWLHAAWPVLATLLGWALVTGVHWMFYQGNITLAWTMRLGLVHVPLLALAGAAALAAARRRWPAVDSGVAVLLAVLLLTGLSRAQQDPRGRTLALPRAYHEALSFLRRYTQSPDRTGRVLVVSDRPGMYLPQGFSAISYATLRVQHRDVRSKLQRQAFTEILAIQQYNAVSGRALRQHRLPAGVRIAHQVHGSFAYGPFAQRIVRLRLP